MVLRCELLQSNLTFNNLHNQEGEPQLITPCLCSGSLKFVHQECLHRWVTKSNIDNSLDNVTFFKILVFQMDQEQ